MAKGKGLKIAVGSALVAATLMTTVPAAGAAGLFNIFSFGGVGGSGISFPQVGGWSFLGNWGGNGQAGNFWGVSNRGFTFGFFWGKPVSPYTT